MKFASALSAPKPRSQTYKMIAWIYAGVLVIMAVGQLFSFEKFMPLLNDYWLPGGVGTATLTASLIVFSEVFALPFLLRMPLSVLMRSLGMVCSLMAAGLWTFLGILAVMSDTAMSNSGMLGMKIVIPSGAVQLVFALMLCGLAIAAVRGLWPYSKK